MTSQEMAMSVFTDEMFERQRQLIGTTLRDRNTKSNDTATKWAVLRFCEGIGDDNPLFLDEHYAARSAVGQLLAPPTFPYSCSGAQQFGWPGLGSFHAGNATTYHRLIPHGSGIHSQTVYTGFGPLQEGSFAGRFLKDYIETTVRDHKDRVVSQATDYTIRYERAAAQGRSGGRSMQFPHPWTEAELAELEEEVLSQGPHGGTRWWEDTPVGTSVDTLTKGPLGLTDEIAFVATGAAPIPRIAAHRIALKRYREHPKWAFRDPSTKALEPIYSVHYNAHAAANMGVAAPYDVGVQRYCWLVQLLTDWMGDDAFLKHVDCQFRGFVYLSDVVRLSGEVIDVRIDDEGDTIVELAVRAINQRDEDVMPGRAVVALPSKDLSHRRPHDGRIDPAAD